MRLQTKAFKDANADLRLRIEKLKFSCGVADCGLKKTLALPSSDQQDPNQLAMNCLWTSFVHQIIFSTGFHKTLKIFVVLNSSETAHKGTIWR